MGRRWVVEIKRDDLPESAEARRLYLCRFSTLAGMPGHPDDEPELRPVTIPYATKFVTKREATALAEERGLKNYEVKRTWW